MSACFGKQEGWAGAGRESTRKTDLATMAAVMVLVVLDGGVGRGVSCCPIDRETKKLIFGACMAPGVTVRARCLRK